MPNPQRFERRIERQLGDLGREPLAAGDERRMIVADVRRRGLRGRAGRHVDRPLALRVDEDLGQRARASGEVEARLDARLLHRSAERTPGFVVRLPTEETDPRAEERGPTGLIEQDAPDARLDRSPRVDVVEQALLVRSEHAPGPVHAIEDHAADADELELLFGFPSGVSHVSRPSSRSASSRPAPVRAPPFP